jgi:CNT family concentrative nucleoside transporter
MFMDALQVCRGIDYRVPSAAVEAVARALSGRSRLILTYALCGFANFGSLGIMVGGIAAMVPQRRAEIASLGAKTMVSGTLATLMTAAVVGLMTAG